MFMFLKHNFFHHKMLKLEERTYNQSKGEACFSCPSMQRDSRLELLASIEYNSKIKWYN